MAYYGTQDYLENKEFTNRLKAIFCGDLGLEWMKPEGERVKCEVPPGRFSYANVNVGAYGYETLPEYIRINRSLAPRGARRPEGLPDFQPMVNDRDEVWGYNVVPLYEEAKTRQWNATTDIPWQELNRCEIPLEIEIAFCQLCTLLSEVGVLSADIASRWVYLINHELFEVKSFLCTQMLDGARMTEVFRKRALLKGYGLGQVSAPAEHFFKHLFEADTFSEACASFYLLCGSLVLGVCRHGEYVAPTLTDKRIFRLVMQDMARLVAYGVAHLRYFLSHQPKKLEVLSESPDYSEALAAGFLGSPELLKPLIVLSGKGRASAGIAPVQACLEDTLIEYFARCDRAGLGERKGRSKLDPFFAYLL